MIVDWVHVLAGLVAAFLAGYLIVALLKPEWYS